MNPKFRADKTTQAASLLLKLRTEKMSYMKLVKLLYLADREALKRWGRPISYDSYVSMDHGLVLSRTLNLINASDRSEAQQYWSKFISPPFGDHEIQSIKDPGTENLSESEEELLNEIFTEFGKMSRWEIVDYVHTLPEWIDPKGSAIPIQYEDVLTGGGKTEAETASIKNEIEEIALAELFLT